MQPEKLVMMANQIGRFFASQPHTDATAGTADHIRKFWDPRMRSAILAHLAAGGAGLDPVPLRRRGNAQERPGAPPLHPAQGRALRILSSGVSKGRLPFGGSGQSPALLP